MLDCSERVDDSYKGVCVAVAARQLLRGRLVTWLRISTTQDFRKLSDEEKLLQLPTLLKKYQVRLDRCP